MRVRLSKLFFIRLLLVCGLCLFLFLPITFKLTNSTFSVLTYPFLLFQNYLSSPFKYYFTLNSDLQQKYESLKKNYEDIVGKYAELEAGENLRAYTRDLRDFKRRYNLKNAQLAQVIYRKNTNHEIYFLLNKGVYHGIEQNMVGIYKNNLVGKVTKVFPFYSYLTLITDSSIKVSVYSSKNNTEGIVSGKNNNFLYLDNVNHLSELNEDEILFSTGQGLVYPRGFILGKLTNVNSNGIYKFADVKPIIDLTSIDFLYLIKKGKY